MAIKISGTEVISNSRGLNNIASIDATTAAAISAGGVGGGGGAFDFVASGAISNGDPVGLNADGTVSSITSFSGSPAVFESAVSNYISITFDSNSNRVVISYSDAGNSQYPTVVVGTVSGNSISFGTPVVLESLAGTVTASTFDSNSNKVVVAYRNSSNAGRAAVGTVSGTSISFGSVATVGNVAELSSTFDSNSNKVVMVYRDAATNYGRARVGTVSGTSISFGTEATFDFSLSTVSPQSATFDSNSNKVVIAYRDGGNSNYGTAIVGTVSGTSISFGTPVVYQSSNSTTENSAVFDSASNKVVIAYEDNQAVAGKAIVGTVSGTSISFGSATTFKLGAVVYNSLTVDSASNTIVLAYRDSTNSNYGTFVAGTVVGTSISFGEPVVFNNSSSDYTFGTFDSNSNRAVITYRDNGNSSYGTAFVLDVGAYSTLSNWIGIAAENISDTATGSINIIGGVNEGQTGLATTQKYYLQDDGTISTTAVSGREVGRALSSTKLLITQGSIS